MNDENGGNGRRRRNRNAAIGGVTQAEQEIQEQVEEPTDATPQHADSLDDLLRGIYSSVVEAQNTIEQHYIGEISEDYFDEEGNPRAIAINLPTADGGLKEVKIPLITLVPHRTLSIKKVKIKLNVALGKYDGEKKQGEKGGLSQYYADLSGRKEGIEPAQLEVHFVGSDAPEGLSRIKDQLIKIIPS